MSLPFETTNWSLIIEAADEGREDSLQALDQLCRRYRPPLLAYSRRFGLSEPDAEDATQSFFHHFIRSNLPSRANRDLGRFRSFLMVSLRNFLNAQHRHATRERRGGGTAEHVSLDDDQHGLADQLAAEDSPELAYDREWARTLVRIAMDALAAEQAAQGKGERFELMRPMLLDPERRDEIHAELCAKHDLSDGAARVVLSRLRARFRELLRAEVARIVTTPEEMDDEIAYLASHLR